MTVGYGYGGAMATVAMYYEALCPSCRQFDSSVFKQTVLELVPDLDIHLCPYGNAKTIDNGFGGYEFVSQHGPAETYGNKLHACAIDVLQNITAAVVYNACLMDLSQAGRGSDDAAADMAIKQCAKADRGSQLLKYYGDESKKADINHVPTVLVNGVPVSTGNFKEEVYKAVY
ncbi:Legumaturain [Operophtera brumata]|uniref:Legumaturain n=1 Tax=Operophtera brumata TaxID=104452 RepID=A0A0L7LL13_OPEBR|nr:Legumaturain [Operophtera brumata]